MRKKVHPWIGLLVLCLLLVGCGGESTTQGPADTSEPKPEHPKPLAMVLEVSEPTYWRDGEAVDTIDDVALMVHAMQTKLDQGYMATIDDTHERSGQLRVLFETSPNGNDEIDLQAASDETFESLKSLFDERAKASLHDELSFQKTIATSAADNIKQLQQSLQVFQESQRGLPQTDASRLERRKLERQIETTLQAQIDANKLLESLQRKIDRERYITLVRVR